MNDLQARKVACAWHGGQSSPLYAFCSSGAIEDQDALQDELAQCIAGDKAHGSENSDDLLNLFFYVFESGERGPVEGWSDLLW